MQLMEKENQLGYHHETVVVVSIKHSQNMQMAMWVMFEFMSNIEEYIQGMRAMVFLFGREKYLRCNRSR